MADEEVKVKPEVKGEVKHLEIKVTGQDGNEVNFKIKASAPLKKLMEAYCDRQGKSLAAIRFMFDGNRLRPDQTPEQLEMENGDSIDALLEQTGGAF